MTEMSISTQGVSLDDFIRKYDEEGPFELINGEVVPMSPNTLGHSDLAGDLLLLLNNYVLPRNLGKAFVETTFITSNEEESDWVKGSRVPDVMFVSAQHLAAYKAKNDDWRSKPLALIPDLVIEIVSPRDTYSKIDQKVALYLDDGVKLVWVVDPQRKKVAIHTANIAQQINLKVGDTLTGGAVIPDFEVEIRALFE